MINVSIVGASGYGGGELIRLLLDHPEVTIKQVTSENNLGKQVSFLHPNLRGMTMLKFTSIRDLEPCDLLFVSLPNGRSMAHMSRFMQIAKRIIDLGADFRLSEKDWGHWYQSKHTQPRLIPDFTYGIPELTREQIKTSDYVAGPGCEAIVSILSLWPLVKHKLIDTDRIIIDAKMSSSQSGYRASQASHHPERSGAVRSYKPTRHRHAAEIAKALDLKNADTQILISATAIEMVRGLLITAHTFIRDSISEKEIWKVYRQEYKDEQFIKIVKQKQGLYRFPEPKMLEGTNYCDIGFELEPESGRLVVLGAIDNLVKGTAGNAVQCMNIMYGFKENTALTFSGLHPV